MKAKVYDLYDPKDNKILRHKFGIVCADGSWDDRRLVVMPVGRKIYFATPDGIWDMDNEEEPIQYHKNLTEERAIKLLNKMF
jgi:hypothetical protein